MLHTLSTKKQTIRLGAISLAGMLTIIGALWCSGGIRIIEQAKTPAGASIVRVTTAGFCQDIIYQAHSKIGWTQGNKFAPTVWRQGNGYHWWIDLGASPLPDS